MAERFDMHDDDCIYAVRFQDGSYLTGGGSRGPVDEAFIFTAVEAHRKLDRMGWNATIEDVS